MPRRREPTRSEPRKRPSQDRSRFTVEAILVATERVLAEHGVAGATTNRIAEVAGVSIGSLYQYFPNKDALVAQVRERTEASFQREIDPVVERLLDLPVDRAIRGLVELLIARHRETLGVHNALAEEEDALHDALLDRWQGVLEAYLEAHREVLRPRNLPLAARVGLEVIESLTHGIALRDPDLLDDPEFADELCALLAGYFLADPARHRAST